MICTATVRGRPLATSGRRPGEVFMATMLVGPKEVLVIVIITAVIVYLYARKRR